jgi:hypothetical protein
MNILIVVSPKQWTGGALIAYYNAVFLYKKNYNITLVIIDRSGTLDIPHYVYKTLPTIIVQKYSTNHEKVAKELSTRLSSNYDIIHLHLNEAINIFKKASIKGKKIATLHGEYIHKNCHYLDHLICVSDWQTDNISNNYRGQFSVIKNFLIPPKTTTEKI